MNQVLSDFLPVVDRSELMRRAFGMDPHAFQKEFLAMTGPTIVLKGRQVGMTAAMSTLLIADAMTFPGSFQAIISPSQRQSSEVAKRCRDGLVNLGERLVQDSESLLRLSNGSRIASLPGSSRSVRGWSCRNLFLDEAAYLLPETIVAARAIVATGGRLIVGSTPAGDWGLFYEMWQDDDPSWSRLKVRSDEVSTISPEWLATERRALSPTEYAREYECEWQSGAASIFDADRLRSLVVEVPEDMFTRLSRLDRSKPFEKASVK